MRRLSDLERGAIVALEVTGATPHTQIIMHALPGKPLVVDRLRLISRQEQPGRSLAQMQAKLDLHRRQVLRLIDQDVIIAIEVFAVFDIPQRPAA